MNQEIIERLVIDRASGELTPDTAALLEDLLGREPAAQAEAAKIEETLRLAKRALAGAEDRAVLRPSFRSPVWVRWAAGMAACFLAGLGLGLLPVRQRAVAPPAPVFATASDAGFWSARRLHVIGSNFKVQGSRLIWKSPVTKPQWEASS
jgi:anti-sigma factor RsiW